MPWGCCHRRRAPTSDEPELEQVPPFTGPAAAGVQQPTLVTQQEAEAFERISTDARFYLVYAIKYIPSARFAGVHVGQNSVAYYGYSDLLTSYRHKRVATSSAAFALYRSLSTGAVHVWLWRNSTQQ